MFLKRTLAAAAIVLGAATAANAADIPTIAPPPPPPPPPAPVFDWSGPYIGAYAGYVFGVGWVQTGVQAGYNFDLGGLVAGIEGQIGPTFTLPGIIGEVNVNARAGFGLGQALIYGEAGVGYLISPSVFTWNAGGGVEFLINTDMSVFAEAKALGAFGGGVFGVSVQGGLNWHF